jgi:hypothetical protein
VAGLLDEQGGGIGLLSRIFAPTDRDRMAAQYMPGADPADLRTMALANALLQFGAAASQAAPQGGLASLSAGAAAGARGFYGHYDDAMRQGALGMQMARYKRQGEREDEMDRLRRAAILEAQTGGRPIPSRAAAAAMSGQPTPQGLPAPQPGTQPAEAGLNDAIRQNVGLLGQPTRMGSRTLRYDDKPINPITGMKTTGAGADGANFQSSTTGGLGPAMRDYLIANNPATFAQMQAAQNRPHILSRGAKMVDANGRVIAEGGSPYPRVQNFTIGNETVPHQYDEASGQWVPLEGMGGPRFSPRYRGELTPAQVRDNTAIQVARTQLESMGLTTPEAIREAQSEYLPTGRPNPKFNRGVAGLVKRAATRMTGEDPDYESFIASVYGGGSRSQIGAQPAAQPGAAPSRPAIAMPTMPSGGVDASKLRHGETYELPDGRRVRWDSMRRGFEVVQ